MPNAKCTSDLVTGSSVEQGCDGVNEEDLIISFTSYGGFSDRMDKFSVQNFIVGHGKDFYFWPSKYISNGGNVVSSNEFADSSRRLLPIFNNLFASRFEHADSSRPWGNCRSIR